MESITDEIERELKALNEASERDADARLPQACSEPSVADEIKNAKPIATLLFDDTDPLDVAMMASVHGLIKIPYNKHQSAELIVNYLKSTERTKNILILNGNGVVTEEFASKFTDYENVIVYPFPQTKVIDVGATKVGFFSVLEFSTALGFSSSFIQGHVIADIIVHKYPDISPDTFGMTDRSGSEYFMKGVKSHFRDYITAFDALFNNISGAQIYDDCVTIGKYSETFKKQYESYLCGNRAALASKVITVKHKAKPYKALITHACDLTEETLDAMKLFVDRSEHDVSYLMVFRMIPAKIDDKMVDGVVVHVRKYTKNNNDIVTEIITPDTELLFPDAKVTGTGNASSYWFTNKEARTNFPFFR